MRLHVHQYCLLCRHATCSTERLFEHNWQDFSATLQIQQCIQICVWEVVLHRLRRQEDARKDAPAQ